MDICIILIIDNTLCDYMRQIIYKNIKNIKNIEQILITLGPLTFPDLKKKLQFLSLKSLWSTGFEMNLFE